MIVIDSSAAVELICDSATGRKVAERIAEADSLHAPHLIDLEVANALRKLALRSKTDASQCYARLQLFLCLQIDRHEHQVLLPRIWQLRNNLPAYDAAFVALAEVLEAPLLTCDRGLAHGPTESARIEWIRA